MSQPHTQHKPSMINGLNRRRGDRDLGNRPENLKNEYQKYRPFRPGSNNNSGTESFAQPGHQQIEQLNNSTDQTMTTTSKPGENNKLEAFSQTESKNGDPSALLCLTACLIGQTVEVQVKNGSVYSGVFHTANADKDYGIVLRMARLVRNGLAKGGSNENTKELAKRPVKTFIVYANDLVQIIAKDVPIGGESLQNGRSRDNRTEIVTDSLLSQGRHGEIERELKPWTPDKDDPKDLELDSTFQNTWNRNWDQFEINRTLFGVESTFDEELYTTKLERGPQMREREREAWRIAREIEGESTRNLHLAEERGLNFSKELELLDEESRYSSVLRTNEDIGDDNEDSGIDVHNNATFGNPLADSVTVAVGSIESEPFPSHTEEESARNRLPSNLNELKIEPAKKDLSLLERHPITPSLGSHTDDNENLGSAQKDKASQVDRNKRVLKAGGFSSPLVSPHIGDTTSFQALNLDPGFSPVSEDVYREFNEFKLQENAKLGKKQREDQVNELKSFSESLKDLTTRQQIGASGNARKMATAPPASASPIPTSFSSSVGTIPGSDSSIPVPAQNQLAISDSSIESTKVVAVEALSISSVQVETTSSVRHTSSAQVTEVSLPSHNSTASTPAPSSPSSSSGVSSNADSSKKSSLNPNAKEFKLNPNAKSFTPSFTPLRSQSPIVQEHVYVPTQPISPIQTVSVGVNPLLQPVAQGTNRYPPYSPGAAPYVPSQAVYTTPVSGASAVPPALVGGQAPLKVLPQAPQPIRYTSQVPPVQAGPTFVHPSGQLQMMLCPPGQVAYYHPYMQGPMPPPQATQAGQQSQPRHRAPGLQGMQLGVPFIGGQQPFVAPQISNPLPPAPAVLTPAVVAPIQPPSQSVVGGLVPPSGSSSGTSIVRIGGKN